MDQQYKDKAFNIVKKFQQVNDVVNKGTCKVDLEAHDFTNFVLITGRKTVLEFMIDDLRECFFVISEPKLISFVREGGEIVGDVHVIKVTIRLHDGKPFN